MPNINITDSRKRDAVVKAENTGVHEEVRYVDSEGSVASTRKVLKATVAHDFDTLNLQFGEDPQKLGMALVDGDPEVDMERCGVYLWGVSKVYVTSDDGIVYRIEQTEKVWDADGELKETRPRSRAEANVDSEVPLTWTGRKIKKTDAIRRFVFTSKLQIVHVNGLTYDFLYGMAKELDNESSLMMVGGGSGGKDPLVFRRGSVPYRGFLEGRVEGEQYILLLHLSNMELKVPEAYKNTPETGQKSDTGDKAGQSLTEVEKSVVDKEPASADEVTTESSKKRQTKIPEPKQIKSKKSVAKKTPRSTKTDDKPDEGKEKSSPSKKVKKKVAKKSAGKIEKTTGTNSSHSEKSDVGITPEDSSEPGTADAEVSMVAEPQASIDQASIDQASIDQVSVDQTTNDETTGNQTTVNFDDLGVWLKSIRMGKYLKLFIDNEIDVDVLSELSDDDLRELEIPLGSRRRLLKAIAAADSLRAEVAMAVSDISRAVNDKKQSSQSAKKASKKTAKKSVKKKKTAKKKAVKKKATEKKAGKQPE